MEIHDLQSLDWLEVAAIYEDGIRSGNATFETGVPSWEDWDDAHTEVRLLAERTFEFFELRLRLLAECFQSAIGVSAICRFTSLTNFGCDTRTASLLFAFAGARYVSQLMFGADADSSATVMR